MMKPNTSRGFVLNRWRSVNTIDRVESFYKVGDTLYPVLRVDFTPVVFSLGKLK